MARVGGVSGPPPASAQACTTRNHTRAREVHVRPRTSIERITAAIPPSDQQVKPLAKLISDRSQGQISMVVVIDRVVIGGLAGAPGDSPGRQCLARSPGPAGLAGPFSPLESWQANATETGCERTRLRAEPASTLLHMCFLHRAPDQAPRPAAHAGRRTAL